MIKALSRITAALSAAVLCVVPMTASAYDNNDNRRVYHQDLRFFKNLIGDANADGQVDYSDSLTIQLAVQFPDKYKVKSTLWADVNADDIINIIDANLVARRCLGCIDDFQILYGDVNMSGYISIEDINEIKNYYGQDWNHRSMSADKFIRCDADANGVINQQDQKVIINFFNSFEYRY